MDEKEIIESVLDGDTEKFNILVEKYSSKIYRICLSLCGNVADAEDAMQEAFIDSFRYLASLTDKDKFFPWLCSIAKRRSYRQISGRISYADIDEMADFLSFDFVFANSDVSEEKEERVRKALEKMSEKRRQVCEMFYFRNMKINEISSKLSLSKSTVKSRLYDAREFLRKELCDMDTNKENIVSIEEIIKKIKEQIKSLSYYYSLKGGKLDEKYNSEVNRLNELVDKLQNEQTKQYYLSNVLRYRSFSEKDESKKKNIIEQCDKAAEAGKNVRVMADMLLDRYLEIQSNTKALKFLEETAFEKIKEYEAFPDYGYAKGELTFWRGRTMFDLGRLDEAKRDFETAASLIEKSEVYHANAVSAIRETDNMKANSYDPTSGYNATAEGVIFDKGKLFFCEQPGFSRSSNISGVSNDFNSFLYYSSVNRIVFDTNMKPGEKIIGKDQNESLECVSYNEKVSVIAGCFENCLHTKTVSSRPWLGDYTYDVWYAPRVGLIKATAYCKGRTENYELTEYSVLGGDGYMPFAEGNRWVYRNPDIPSYIYQDIERTVDYTDGYFTGIAVTSPFTLVKDFEKCDDIDSSLYLFLADKLCDDWKLTEAMEMLGKAVRLNVNEEAVRISLYGIEVLSRFEEYRNKGYRFCPSSINASYVQTDGNNVSFAKQGIVSFGPYRLGARGRYEDRIFGIKPFRYLDCHTGVLFDEKWVPGYCEERNVEDGLKLIVKVEDGGSVTVPAGTFGNCRKVTLRKDKPENAEDKWYFANRYRNMDAGVKEYWFAPGVGLVKSVSVWGEECYAECLLNKYSVPAASKTEYFPVQIGNSWEYDEPHLTEEGYRAKAIFRIASGMNGKYLMTSSQEFVFLKSEEEYNELQKISHKY